MDYILLLLAQSDPLSGGAGWVGTGLLGAVLSWLLFVHLPAKDKQIKELIENKDKALERKDKENKDSVDLHIRIEKEQREAYLISEREQRADFRKALDSFSTQIMGLMAAFREELEQIVTKFKESK